MAEELSFDELIKEYNLDREEIDALRAENESHAFTQETLKRRVAELQAVKTASKNLEDISFEEIQDAWNVLKDVREDNPDERLVKAKADMLNKSEQAIQNAMETDPTKRHFSTDSMETAPELSEWLKINNTLDISANKERNQNLGARLDAFYAQYDKDNGLTGITAEQSAQIADNRAKLEQLSAAFDPQATGPDGKPLNEALASIAGFYDRLDITPAANGGESIDGPALKDKMLKLARDESIAQLSVDKEFAKLSPEEQAQKFVETYYNRAQMGVVALLTNQYTNGETGNFAQLDAEKQKDVQAFVQNSLKQERITISSEAALATLATAENSDKNFNKRITQKTGIRGLWAKVKERHAKLVAAYPKTMNAVSIISNLGLSVGVNVLAGGGGLAVLGAYKTWQAIKKANEERKKANENSEKKLNFAQYVWKNPRHLVGIVGGAAGAVISGVGGVVGGLDANGLVGQAANHGVSATVDNFTAGISSAWESVKGRVTDLFSGNMGDTAAAAADTAKESAPLSTMKIIRATRTAAVGAATLALDMKDVFSPENKGKRWKAFTGALFKAGLMGGAVYATTSTGFGGEHNSTDHGGEAVKPINEVVSPADGAEAAADAVDFEHANETQLNRTFDADPRGVNAILNDGKFHSSADLHKMMENNEFSDEQLKAIHGLALKDFDENGHIIDPELKAYYENLARQSHVAANNDQDNTVKDDLTQDDSKDETITPEPDKSKDETTEVRDEAYYQDQQDVLKVKGQESLESEINMAVKSDVHTVADTVDGYMDNQVAAGNLSEQQGEELGNYVKSELDAHDGAKDGTIDEEQLSKRDVRGAMKDVKNTLNSMAENADNVEIAKNIDDSALDASLGDLKEQESWSKDTESSKFYKGMSDVTSRMVEHPNDAGKIMSEAVRDGELSGKQAAAMNTRWAELREEGQNPKQALRTMVKDYDNHAKFYEAQEAAAQANVNENSNTQTTDPTTAPENINGDAKTEPEDEKTTVNSDEGKTEPSTTPETVIEEVKEHLAPCRYVLGDIKYNIDDKGNLDANCGMPIGDEDEMLRNLSDLKFKIGDDYSFKRDMEVGRLRTLGIDESVYSDLQRRMDAGETLGNGERAFMSRHEQEMKAAGLTSDENGYLIRADRTDNSLSQKTFANSGNTSTVDATTTTPETTDNSETSKRLAGAKDRMADRRTASSSPAQPSAAKTTKINPIVMGAHTSGGYE